MVEETQVTKVDSFGDNTWLKRNIRPLVTLMFAVVLAVVIIHGTVWCGDRNAFELGATVSTMVIGYWFGGREAAKRR